MNIYTMDGKHIGKRSAAGVWCWDCKKKLDYIAVDDSFVCTACDNTCKGLSYNSALRELGIDTNKPKKHTGIDGASSFCWQVGSCGLGGSIAAVKANLKRRKKVKTEYGDVWNIKQFWDMFKDIIIERSMDMEFS